MDEMLPKVMIGCPVRDRAWVLPRYLEAICSFDYPRDLLTYGFIINDCRDETPQLLENFSRRQVGPVLLHWENHLRPGTAERSSYCFKRLAALRNLLLEQFLRTDCDYLFSIDSDILLPADGLRKLLAADRHIVSALVWNGGHVNRDDVFNILDRDEAGNYLHVHEYPHDTVFPVDCTGAAYLIKREVLSAQRIRYDADHGAEDIGFCYAAQQKGIGIFCHSGVRGEHLMDQGAMNQKVRKNIIIEKK